jgi:hypothetical protein
MELLVTLNATLECRESHGTTLWKNGEKAGITGDNSGKKKPLRRAACVGVKRDQAVSP